MKTIKIIELLVDPAGRTTVQTKGFAGPACQAASQFVEQALGHRTSEKLTPEFHQAAPCTNAQQQQH